LLCVLKNQILVCSMKSNIIELDFLTASDKELYELCLQIPEHNSVIIKNVPDDKYAISLQMAKISGIKPSNMINHDWVNKNYGVYFYSDEDIPFVQRVSNIRSKEGTPTGLFADYNLGWHSDGMVEGPDRICICLHCVNPGESNTGVTSFVNLRDAYKDLPLDIKEIVNQVEVGISLQVFRGDKNPLHNTKFKGYEIPKTDPLSKAYENMDCWNYVFRKPLVMSHPWHKAKSLFFIPTSIVDMKRKDNAPIDTQGLWDYLTDHIFQEKYIYHHKWEAGDLLFNDQWFNLHKRSATAGSRLLHRWYIPMRGLIDY